MIYTGLSALAGLAVGGWGLYRAAWARDDEHPIARAVATASIPCGLMLAISSTQSLVPVLTDPQVTVLSRGAADVVLAVTVGKARDCERGEVRAHVIGRSGRSYAASIDFDPGTAAIDGPPASMPVGRLALPDRRVRWVEQAEPVTAVVFRLTHDCGRLLQLTRTTLGPFPIPPAPHTAD